MSEDGTFDVLPKKEVINLKKEWDKLEKNLGGIKEMDRIPDAIFFVDPKKERICVQEAHTLGIPPISFIVMRFPANLQITPLFLQPLRKLPHQFLLYPVLLR